MLKTTNLSSEFENEIAEYAIELLKDNFGNTLEIFIGHRWIDDAVNIEFTFNDIRYSIKVYKEDNLIVCGVQAYKYKGITYEDDNLFLLTGERNTLSASKECINGFIKSVVSDKYFYVKHILSKLTDLNELVDLKEAEQKKFVESTIRFLQNGKPDE
ncbi:hypothetical protein ACI6PS_06680 [Flavobacterium sp. PLA-1-15]|uniref:hypothetical protein n=1 Tax=Flavobacterium sp. PLA-1-15 TaxID=3380533 RepID=UPI003B7976F5